MTSSQPNTRRRSARLAFDDDDNGAPLKKTKMDEPTHRTEKRADARVNGDAGKKSKKKYNDGNEDFQFSRKGSKKAQQKPVEVLPPVQEKEPEPPKPKPKPKVKKMLPVTPVPAEKQTRRRSERLSGDNNQVPTERSQSPTKKAKEKEKPPQDKEKPPQGNGEPSQSKENRLQEKQKRPQDTEKRQQDNEKPLQDNDGSPVLANGVSPLQIPKRQDATKIALPFADTPINKRNKELRKGHRRSSTGLRGRRASSLIESGTSNAVPHTEVETSDFYKLISQDMPEPRRMKQLLTWCGTRALPNKPTGIVEGSNAIMAARAIQEELLKEFSSRSELSDWFSREDTEPAVLVKKPNPRNIQNAVKLKELEQEVERLSLEKRSWEDMLKSASALPSTATAPTPSLRPDSRTPSKAPLSTSSTTTTKPPPSSHRPTIDPALLSPSQTPLLASITSSSSASAEAAISTRLRALASSLEFRVDQFADGVHQLEQHRRRGEEVADAVLSRAAQRLEDRDRGALRRQGTQGVDARDVLRELSRVVDGGS
ncbi:MAG: hypothetical protein M1822_003048 [Bathelium mastoideum]|nr:MAG: hypothetical protein M1822_003048 [Bathelium mastoideum]